MHHHTWLSATGFLNYFPALIVSPPLFFSQLIPNYSPMLLLSRVLIFAHIYDYELLITTDLC